MQYSVISNRIIVSMGPSPYLWILRAKQRLLEQNYKSLWIPDLTCRFVRAKQRDETQALQVPALICVFCMQNSVFWSRITSLYGSQTSPVALWMQNSVICIRLTSLYGSQPSSVVFACKTAWLASESLVSMGPSPHLWFLQAKQRLLDPNSKSLCVPDITCRFVPAIQRD